MITTEISKFIRSWKDKKERHRVVWLEKRPLFGVQVTSPCLFLAIEQSFDRDEIAQRTSVDVRIRRTQVCPPESPSPRSRRRIGLFTVTSQLRISSS